MTMSTRSVFAGSPRVQALRGACVIGAIAAFAAACGGGSGTSSATAPSSASSAPAAAAAGTGVTIATHSGAYGTYLSDGAGRSLYMFQPDKSGTSTCYGACAKFWPPLTSSSAAQAGGGVQQAMLGTTKRTDGATQITFAGHPLYYFAQDKSVGDTKGEGLNLSGGNWYLLSTSGASITSKSSTPAQNNSSSSSGGGGGYGY
jgi:predicted lipoprotein with Yx(FWY)xxD motif